MLSISRPWRLTSSARLCIELALLVGSAVAVINAWGKVHSARTNVQRSEFEARFARREAAELREQAATRALELQQHQRDALARRSEVSALSKQVESLKSQLQSTRQGAVQLRDTLKNKDAQLADHTQAITLYTSFIEGMLTPSHWRTTNGSHPTMPDVVEGGLKRLRIAHSSADQEFLVKLRLMLSRSLIAAGSADAAEPLMAQTVEDLTAEFGEQDARTIEARIQLARCFAAQDRFDQAMTQCMQALQRSAADPRRHRSVAQKARKVMLECLISAPPPPHDDESLEWCAFAK